MVKFEDAIEVDEGILDEPQKADTETSVEETQKTQKTKVSLTKKNKILIGSIAALILAAISCVILIFTVFRKDKGIELPTDNIHQTVTNTADTHLLENYELTDLGVYECLGEVWAQVNFPTAMYEKPSTAVNGVETIQEGCMVQLLNNVHLDGDLTAWSLVKDPLNNKQGFVDRKNMEIILGYNQTIYDREQLTGLKIREGFVLTEEQKQALGFGEGGDTIDDFVPESEEVEEVTSVVDKEKIEQVVNKIETNRTVIDARNKEEQEKIKQVTEYVVNNNLGFVDAEGLHMSTPNLSNGKTTFVVETGTVLSKRVILALYDFLWG